MLWFIFVCVLSFFCCFCAPLYSCNLIQFCIFSFHSIIALFFLCFFFFPYGSLIYANTKIKKLHDSVVAIIIQSVNKLGSVYRDFFFLLYFLYYSNESMKKKEGNSKCFSLFLLSTFHFLFFPLFWFFFLSLRLFGQK